MKNKKIAFLFMILSLTHHNSSIYAAQKVEQIANEKEISPEQWQYLTDLHEKVMEQTTKIEFCLQTVAQIINSNKLKVNTNKTSKSQLFEQAIQIKNLISSFSQISLAEMQTGSYDIIEKGLYYNRACIDYLLPIFTNDVNDLNAENFNTTVITQYQKLVNNTSSMPIEEQIKANEKNIEALIKASENVGLSVFNKFYRYLDTQPVPFYGKSTLATLYDLGMLGLISAGAYGLAVYNLPEGTTIPLVNIKVEDLPGRKNIIGQSYNAAAINAPSVPQTIKKDLANNLTVFETANLALEAAKNPLVVATVPLLLAGAMPYLEDAWKYSKKQINNLLTYYGQGDASQLNNQNYVKAYFKDMIGGQAFEKEAKLIADYIKNPVRYERQGNSPATGYLLIGPSQTGKSFFARALRTLIDEQFINSQQKVGFIDVTTEAVEKLGFAQIFAIANDMAPVILFIDELDMHGVRRARNEKRTQELLTAMSGMTTNPHKKIIVIAATNRPEELDFALKQKGRFGNIITFDYPNYQSRKEYLTKQLKKQNIALSPTMIETITQETNGQTFNMIDDIIRQARQISTYKLRPVQEHDFEIVLDKEIRKIKQNVSMSDIETELVAIYQAGQAVARQVLPTERQVVKITIDSVEKPIASKEGHDVKTEDKSIQYENIDLVQQERTKYNRLGFVFTSSPMNHNELIHDEEQEKELIALLSGQAALELIKGKTFSAFGKEDRAKVLDSLEKKISQGTVVTNEIRQQAIKEKDRLYLQAKTVLKPHVPFVQKIADQLIKNHTINKVEWIQLISSMPKVENVASPAATAVSANNVRLAVAHNKRPIARR